MARNNNNNNAWVGPNLPRTEMQVNMSVFTLSSDKKATIIINNIADSWCGVAHFKCYLLVDFFICVSSSSASELCEQPLKMNRKRKFAFV